MPWFKKKTDWTEKLLSTAEITNDGNQTLQTVNPMQS